MVRVSLSPCENVVAAETVTRDGRDRITRHQEIIGMALTIAMTVVLWVTFRTCKTCVLGVFIVSSLLCMRLPYLQIVFWPSLLILILNMRLLRGLHVKVDVPVGESIDNLWS